MVPASASTAHQDVGNDKHKQAGELTGPCFRDRRPVGWRRERDRVARPRTGAGGLRFRPPTTTARRPALRPALARRFRAPPGIDRPPRNARCLHSRGRSRTLRRRGRATEGVSGYLVEPAVFKTVEGLYKQSLVGSIPIHSRPAKTPYNQVAARYAAPASLVGRRAADGVYLAVLVRLAACGPGRRSDGSLLSSFTTRT